MGLSLKPTDRMTISASIFVIDLENGLAAFLLLALDDGYKRGSVEAGGTLYPCHL